MDRRVPIFLLCALVCAAMIPVADAGHRAVAAGTALTYVVLAILFWLDSVARRGRRRAAEKR